MYSDMSIRIIASSSPNRNSARVRASSVLPTPEGPRKMNEPAGRFGSLIPARERRIALDTAVIAMSWPITRLCSSSSIRTSFFDSASVSLKTGIPVHIATMSALAALARGPLVLELLLLVGQAALLIAQVGGLLELLGVDRGLLLAPGRLDLLLEIAIDGRLRHRLDAHAGGCLVDQVDGLVRQEAVGDVAVGELRGGLEGLVGDLHAVVLLVALAQALEDLHGLLGGGLLDLDLLETALERGVALQVLAVLVKRGGADR